MGNNIVSQWLKYAASSLSRCITRFPLAFAFIVLLTIWCIILNHGNEPGDERLCIILSYYLPVGIPLSLMLQLWSEEVASRAKRMATHAIGQSILLADALLLYLLDNISTTIIIAHAAVVTAVVVAIFIIPFLKWNNDMPCWNFAMRSAVAYIKAALVGLLFTFGIILLIVSIQQLFDLPFGDRLYADIMIVCNIGLTLLLFIGMMPAGDAKHDRLPHTNNFLNILVRYVFIPLTAAYILVLYAYAARILVTWQLPNGYVSWLVAASMAGCIIIEAGLYPFRQFPAKKKADEFIARWLPMFILPLLVLMTIGIARRFNDYGITVTRLYLAAFNAWCYAVCIILFITRARRISWIPASFAAVFLFTSVLPWLNFSNITRTALCNEIETAMEQTCTDTPPLSEEQYANWINNIMPYSEGQNINDKLMYLQNMYGNNSYDHLVADSVKFYIYESFDTVYTEGDYYGFYTTLENGIDIPDGATHITEVDVYDYSNVSFLKDEAIPIALNNSDTVYIDFATLRQLNTKESYGEPYTGLPQNSNSFKFILTSISATVGDSICISQIKGYLFQLNNNNDK